MPIFNISNAQHKESKLSSEPLAQPLPPIEEKIATPARRRDRFFSTCVARAFFLLLLIADLFWIGYALFLFLFAVLGQVLSFNKLAWISPLKEKGWIALRRSLVCGISLFIALFSPAFGIMIACTYFLMYDPSGIEEVVPSSLREQFKEFLPS